MAFDQSDIIELKEPVWAKVYGQGDPPRCITVIANGEKYELFWGTQYSVSETTDEDNQIGNLDYGGDHPLLRKEFVNEIESQFKLIKEAE